MLDSKVFQRHVRHYHVPLLFTGIVLTYLSVPFWCLKVSDDSRYESNGSFGVYTHSHGYGLKFKENILQLGPGINKSFKFCFRLK